MEFDHVVNDALMRFFDKCTRFLEEVDNNPSAVTEVEKFKQGPEMRRVQQKIADILNVPYSSITYGCIYKTRLSVLSALLLSVLTEQCLIYNIIYLTSKVLQC